MRSFIRWTAPPLFQIQQQHREVGGVDAADAARLAEARGPDLLQLFLCRESDMRRYGISFALRRSCVPISAPLTSIR